MPGAPVFAQVSRHIQVCQLISVQSTCLRRPRRATGTGRDARTSRHSTAPVPQGFRGDALSRRPALVRRGRRAAVRRDVRPRPGRARPTVGAVLRERLTELVAADVFQRADVATSCAVSPRALPSPTRPAESPPTARSRNWRGPRPRQSRPTRNSASSAASRSGGRSPGIPDPPTPLFTWWQHPPRCRNG